MEINQTANDNGINVVNNNGIVIVNKPKDNKQDQNN